MSERHPTDRFYSIIAAFQHFAGKPLKVLDHAAALTETELSVLEQCLWKLAVSVKKEDPKEWPELAVLSFQIEKYVPEKPKMKVLCLREELSANLYGVLTEWVEDNDDVTLENVFSDPDNPDNKDNISIIQAQRELVNEILDQLV